MKPYVFLATFLILCSACGESSKSSKKNLTGQVTGTRAVQLVKKPLNVTQALPTHSDLSQFAPIPAEQPFNNCYAYATVHGARTILYNASNQLHGHPDSTRFSTAYICQQMAGSGFACRNSGRDFYDACVYMQQQGVIFKKDYTEDCSGKQITPELRARARSYTINAMILYEPCDSEDDKILSVKSALAAGHPVPISWLVMNSFDNIIAGTELWEPTLQERKYNGCQNGDGHAICVVAYDDNKFGGAFKVINSWGTDWADSGFAWVKYKDFAQYSTWDVEMANP